MLVFLWTVKCYRLKKTWFISVCCIVCSLWTNVDRTHYWKQMIIITLRCLDKEFWKFPGITAHLKMLLCAHFTAMWLASLTAPQVFLLVFPSSPPPLVILRKCGCTHSDSLCVEMLFLPLRACRNKSGPAWNIHIRPLPTAFYHNKCSFLAVRLMNQPAFTEKMSSFCNIFKLRFLLIWHINSNTWKNNTEW